jgi:hypothetical protein
VRGYGLPGERAASRRPAWRPLRARLAAIVFCAAAAGGGVITAAGHLAAQDYLTQQAGRQLRSYADVLTARPFTVFPGFRLAPGAAGLGAAGRDLGIAVRASGGQLLMSAGPAAPPAAGRGWLEISEPVSYGEEHIPFVYGADNFSVSVAPKARPGLAGTLVIGLDLASVGRAVDGLTVTCLAVTGLAVLAAAGAAAGATRRLLRPLDLAAETEAAAAEASARAAAGRAGAAVAGACGQMRRPLSIVAGLADYYRKRGGLDADGADRVMRQLEREAARMAALVDELEAAARDGPHPGGSPAAGPPARKPAGPLARDRERVAAWRRNEPSPRCGPANGKC